MTQSETPLRVAVITGGHPYDVPNFQRLFRSLPGVDAYIQHLEDFVTSPEEVRKSYDVVLFYTMLVRGPSDDHPWYAGEVKTVLSQLGETNQGILVLHHAILNYPDWDLWRELSGIHGKFWGYHHDETLDIKIVNHDHPITRGLADWTMIDETYEMGEPDPGNEMLMTVDHPQSMKAVGWVRTYRNARVFSFQSGHDNQTWVDATFREVLHRGILWCAGRS